MATYQQQVDFIKTYWPTFQQVQNETGVSALALATHAAMESGWGTSDLAKDGNLYGIKVHNSGHKGKFYSNATEYVGWVEKQQGDYFRVYDDPKDSIYDYISFIAGNPGRYGSAWEKRNDPDAFLTGIVDAGYMTLPLNLWQERYRPVMGKIANLMDREVTFAKDAGQYKNDIAKSMLEDGSSPVDIYKNWQINKADPYLIPKDEFIERYKDRIAPEKIDELYEQLRLEKARIEAIRNVNNSLDINDIMLSMPSARVVHDMYGNEKELYTKDKEASMLNYFVDKTGKIQPLSLYPFLADNYLKRAETPDGDSFWKEAEDNEFIDANLIKTARDREFSSSIAGSAMRGLRDGLLALPEGIAVAPGLLASFWDDVFNPYIDKRQRGYYKWNVNWMNTMNSMSMKNVDESMGMFENGRSASYIIANGITQILGIFLTGGALGAVGRGIASFGKSAGIISNVGKFVTISDRVAFEGAKVIGGLEAAAAVQNTLVSSGMPAHESYGYLWPYVAATYLAESTFGFVERAGVKSATRLLANPITTKETKEIVEKEISHTMAKFGVSSLNKLPKEAKGNLMKRIWVKTQMVRNNAKERALGLKGNKWFNALAIGPTTEGLEEVEEGFMNDMTALVWNGRDYNESENFIALMDNYEFIKNPNSNSSNDVWMQRNKYDKSDYKYLSQLEYDENLNRLNHSQRVLNGEDTFQTGGWGEQFIGAFIPTLLTFGMLGAIGAYKMDQPQYKYMMWDLAHAVIKNPQKKEEFLSALNDLKLTGDFQTSTENVDMIKTKVMSDLDLAIRLINEFGVESRKLFVAIRKNNILARDAFSLLYDTEKLKEKNARIELVKNDVANGVKANADLGIKEGATEADLIKLIANNDKVINENTEKLKKFKDPESETVETFDEETGGIIHTPTNRSIEYNGVIKDTSEEYTRYYNNIKASNAFIEESARKYADATLLKTGITKDKPEYETKYREYYDQGRENEITKRFLIYDVLADKLAGKLSKGRTNHVDVFSMIRDTFMYTLHLYANKIVPRDIQSKRTNIWNELSRYTEGTQYQQTDNDAKSFLDKLDSLITAKKISALSEWDNSDKGDDALQRFNENMGSLSGLIENASQLASVHDLSGYDTGKIDNAVKSIDEFANTLLGDKADMFIPTSETIKYHHGQLKTNIQTPGRTSADIERKPTETELMKTLEMILNHSYGGLVPGMNNIGIKTLFDYAYDKLVTAATNAFFNPDELKKITKTYSMWLNALRDYIVMNTGPFNTRELSDKDMLDSPLRKYEHIQLNDKIKKDALKMIDDEIAKIGQLDAKIEENNISRESSLVSAQFSSVAAESKLILCIANFAETHREAVKIDSGPFAAYITSLDKWSKVKLSTDEEIKSIDNLFKIYVATSSAELRNEIMIQLAMVDKFKMQLRDALSGSVDGLMREINTKATTLDTYFIQELSNAILYDVTATSFDTSNGKINPNVIEEAYKLHGNGTSSTDRIFIFMALNWLKDTNTFGSNKGSVPTFTMAMQMVRDAITDMGNSGRHIPGYEQENVVLSLLSFIYNPDNSFITDGYPKPEYNPEFPNDYYLIQNNIMTIKGYGGVGKSTVVPELLIRTLNKRYGRKIKVGFVVTNNSNRKKIEDFISSMTDIVDVKIELLDELLGNNSKEVVDRLSSTNDFIIVDEISMGHRDYVIPLSKNIGSNSKARFIFLGDDVQPVAHVNKDGNETLATDFDMWKHGRYTLPMGEVWRNDQSQLSQAQTKIRVGAFVNKKDDWSFMDFPMTSMVKNGLPIGGKFIDENMIGSVGKNFLKHMDDHPDSNTILIVATTQDKDELIKNPDYKKYENNIKTIDYDLNGILAATGVRKDELRNNNVSGISADYVFAEVNWSTQKAKVGSGAKYARMYIARKYLVSLSRAVKYFETYGDVHNNKEAKSEGEIFPSNEEKTFLREKRIKGLFDDDYGRHIILTDHDVNYKLTGHTPPIDKALIIDPLTDAEIDDIRIKTAENIKKLSEKIPDGVSRLSDLMHKDLIKNDKKLLDDVRAGNIDFSHKDIQDAIKKLHTKYFPLLMRVAIAYTLEENAERKNTIAERAKPLFSDWVLLHNIISDKPVEEDSLPAYFGTILQTIEDGIVQDGIYVPNPSLVFDNKASSPSVIEIIGYKSDGDKIKPIIVIKDYRRIESEKGKDIKDDDRMTHLGGMALLATLNGYQVARIEDVQFYMDGVKRQFTHERTNIIEGETLINAVSMASAKFGIKTTPFVPVTQNDINSNARRINEYKEIKPGNVYTTSSNIIYYVDSISVKNDIVMIRTIDKSGNIGDYEYDNFIKTFSPVTKNVPTEWFAEQGIMFKDFGLHAETAILPSNAHKTLGVPSKNFYNVKNNKVLRLKHLISGGLNEHMKLSLQLLRDEGFNVVHAPADQNGLVTNFAYNIVNPIEGKYPIVAVISDADLLSIIKSNLDLFISEFPGLNSAEILTKLKELNMNYVSVLSEPEFDYTRRKVREAKLDLMNKFLNSTDVEESNNILNDIFSDAFAAPEREIEGISVSLADKYRESNIRANKGRLILIKRLLKDGKIDIGITNINQGRIEMNKKNGVIQKRSVTQLIQSANEHGFSYKKNENGEPDFYIGDDNMVYLNVYRSTNANPVSIQFDGRKVNTDDYNLMFDELTEIENALKEGVFDLSTQDGIKMFVAAINDTDASHFIGNNRQTLWLLAEKHSKRDSIKFITNADGQLRIRGAIKNRIRYMRLILDAMKNHVKIDGKIPTYYMFPYKNKNIIIDNLETGVLTLRQQGLYLGVNDYIKTAPEASGLFMDLSNRRGVELVNFDANELYDTMHRILGDVIGPRNKFFKNSVLSRKTEDSSNIWGQVYNRTISIFTKDGKMAKNVGRHEAIHFLLLYMVSPEKYHQIMQFAEKEMVNNGKILPENHLDRIISIHEYIAEQFEVKRKPDTILGEFIAWVVKLVKRLFGNRNILDDFFTEADRGVYSNTTSLYDNEPELSLYKIVANHYTESEQVKMATDVFTSLNEVDRITDSYIANLWISNSPFSKDMAIKPDVKPAASIKLMIKELKDISSRYADRKVVYYNRNGVSIEKKVSDLTSEDYIEIIHDRDTNLNAMDSYVIYNAGLGVMPEILIQRFDKTFDIEAMLKIGRGHIGINTYNYINKNGAEINPWETKNSFLKHIISRIPLYSEKTGKRSLDGYAQFNTIDMLFLDAIRYLAIRRSEVTMENIIAFAKERLSYTEDIATRNTIYSFIREFGNGVYTDDEQRFVRTAGREIIGMSKSSVNAGYLYLADMSTAQIEELRADILKATNNQLYLSIDYVHEKMKLYQNLVSLLLTTYLSRVKQDLAIVNFAGANGELLVNMNVLEENLLRKMQRDIYGEIIGTDKFLSPYKTMKLADGDDTVDNNKRYANIKQEYVVSVEDVDGKQYLTINKIESNDVSRTMYSTNPSNEVQMTIEDMADLFTFIGLPSINLDALKRVQTADISKTKKENKLMPQIVDNLFHMMLSMKVSQLIYSDLQKAKDKILTDDDGKKIRSMKKYLTDKYGIKDIKNTGDLKKVYVPLFDFGSSLEDLLIENNQVEIVKLIDNTISKLQSNWKEIIKTGKYDSNFTTLIGIIGAIKKAINDQDRLVSLKNKLEDVAEAINLLSSGSYIDLDSYLNDTYEGDEKRQYYRLDIEWGDKLIKYKNALDAFYTKNGYDYHSLEEFKKLFENKLLYSDDIVIPTPADFWKFVKDELTEFVKMNIENYTVRTQFTVKGKPAYSYPLSSYLLDLFPQTWDSSVTFSLKIKDGINKLNTQEKQSHELVNVGGLSNNAYNNPVLNNRVAFSFPSVLDGIKTLSREKDFSELDEFEVIKLMIEGLIIPSLYGRTNQNKVPTILDTISDKQFMPLFEVFSMEGGKVKSIFRTKINRMYTGGFSELSIDATWVVRCLSDIARYYQKVNVEAIKSYDKVKGLSAREVGMSDAIEGAHYVIKDGKVLPGSAITMYETSPFKKIYELAKSNKLTIELAKEVFTDRFMGLVDLLKSNEYVYPDHLNRMFSDKWPNELTDGFNKMDYKERFTRNDGKTWHPVIESAFWMHMIFNESLSMLTRDNWMMYGKSANENDNVFTYIKRAAGMIAPGNIYDTRSKWSYLGKYSRVLYLDDPKGLLEAYGKNSVDAFDGVSLMMPWFRSALINDSGGMLSTIGDSVVKNVNFYYDPVKRFGVYHKYAQFPITKNQYQSPYIRRLIEVALGELNNVTIEGKTFMQHLDEDFDKASKMISDYILTWRRSRGSKPNVIDYYIYKSAVKTKASKVMPQWVDGGSKDYNDIIGKDKFDIPLEYNSDQYVHMVNNSTMRQQIVTAQDVEEKEKTIATQFMFILGALPHNSERIKAVNQALKEYQDKILADIERLDTKEDIIKYMRKISARYAHYFSYNSKFEEMVIDENIDINLFRDAIFNHFITHISKYTLPSVPGSVFIQAPGFSKIYWKDGQPYLKQDIKETELGSYDARLLGTIRFDGDNLVKADVIVPFFYMRRFGITEDMTLASSMTLSSPVGFSLLEDKKIYGKVNMYGKGEVEIGSSIDAIANAYLDTVITEDITFTWKEHIYKGKDDVKNIMTSLIKQGLSPQEIGHVLEMENKYVFQQRAIGASNPYIAIIDIMPSSQREVIMSLIERGITPRDALIKYFVQFNRALDVFAMRIPTSNASSGFVARVVGFDNGASNTIWVSPLKNILDGSDWDIDALHVYWRAMTDGLDEPTKEKDALRYMQNVIFENVDSYYRDVRNSPFIFRPIDISTFKKRGEEKMNSVDTFKYHANDLASMIKSKVINHDSKRLVGHFANLEHFIFRVMSIPYERRMEIFNNLPVFKDDSKIPDIVDLVNKFINAATDNPTLGGLLGYLNVNEYTSPLISGMILSGKTEDEIFEALEHPLIVNTVEKARKTRRALRNNHNYSNTNYGVWGTIYDFLDVDDVKKVATDIEAKDDKITELSLLAQRYKNYAIMGEALRRMADVIGVMRDFPNNLFDLDRRIRNTEFDLGQSLDEYLSGKELPSVSKQIEFARTLRRIRKEENESNVRQQLKYGLFFRDPVIVNFHNLLNVLNMAKNTAAKVFYTRNEAKWIVDTIQKKIAAKSLNIEDEYTDIKNGIDDALFGVYVADKYSGGNSITMDIHGFKGMRIGEEFKYEDLLKEFKQTVFDLSNERDRYYFVTLFPYYYRQLKLKEEYKNNLFIKRISLGFTKLNKTLIEVVELKNGYEIPPADKKLIRDDFTKLSSDDRNLFELYAYLVYGIRMKRGSFADVTDMNKEVEYSAWLRNMMTKEENGKTKLENKYPFIPDNIIVRGGIARHMYRDAGDIEMHEWSNFTGRGEYGNIVRDKAKEPALMRKMGRSVSAANRGWTAVSSISGFYNSYTNHDMLHYNETLFEEITAEDMLKLNKDGIVSMSTAQKSFIHFGNARPGLVKTDTDVLLPDGDVYNITSDGLSITISSKEKKASAVEISNSRVSFGVVEAIIEKLSNLFPNIKVKVFNNNNAPFKEIAIIKNGEVWFNEDKIQLDTPFHEFIGHILIDLLEVYRPDFYNALRSEALGMIGDNSAIVSKIKQSYPNLHGNDLVKEVIANMVGWINAEKAGAYMGKMGVTGKDTIWNNIKNTIAEIWRAISSLMAKMFGLKKPNIGDIDNMTIRGFANTMMDRINHGGAISYISSKQYDKLSKGAYYESAEIKITNVKDIKNSLVGNDLTEEQKKKRTINQIKSNIKREGYKLETTFSTLPFEFRPEELPTADNRIWEIVERSKEGSRQLFDNLLSFLSVHNANVEKSGEIFGINGQTHKPLISETNLNRLAHIMEYDGSTRYFKYSDLKTNKEYSFLYDAEFDVGDTIIAIESMSDKTIVVSLYRLSTSYITKQKDAGVLNKYISDSKAIGYGITLGNSDLDFMKLDITLLANRLQKIDKRVSINNIGVTEFGISGVLHHTVDPVVMNKNIMNLAKVNDFMQTVSNDKIIDIVKSPMNRCNVDYLDVLRTWYNEFEERKRKEGISDERTYANDMRRIVRNEVMTYQEKYRILSTRLKYLYEGRTEEMVDKFTSEQMKEVKLLINAIVGLHEIGKIDMQQNIMNTVDDNNKYLYDSLAIGDKNVQSMRRLIQEASGRIVSLTNKKAEQLDKMYMIASKEYGTRLGSYAVEDSWKIWDQLVVRFKDKDENGNEFEYMPGFIYWTNDESKCKTEVQRRMARQAQELGISKEMLDIGNSMTDMIEELLAINLFNKITNRIGGAYNWEKRAMYTMEDAKADVHTKLMYQRGMLPLMTKSTAEHFSKLGFTDIKRGIAKKVRQVGDAQEILEQIDYRQVEISKSFMELDDIFFFQFGYGAKSDMVEASNTDIGFDDRLRKLLGLESISDSEGNPHIRIIDKKKNNDISLVLNKVLEYFALSTYRNMEYEGKVLPVVNGMKILLKDKVVYGKEKGVMDNLENAISYLDIFTKLGVKGERKVMNITLPTAFGVEWNVDKTGTVLMSVAAPIVLVGNINIGMISLLTNTMYAYIDGIANQLVERGLFNIKDLTNATKEFMTHPAKAARLMKQYRIMNMNEYDLIHHYTNRIEQRNAFNNFWATVTNWGPDYLARSIMMIAQMIHDGSWDAHSIDDNGNVVYDPDKDKRYASRLKSKEQMVLYDNLIRLLVDDEVWGQKSNEKPVMGYDLFSMRKLKAVSDKFVVGSFDVLNKNIMGYYLLGRMFGMFKNWFVTRWTNATAKHTSIDDLGQWVAMKDENGNIVPKWQQLEMEGYIRTMGSMATTLFKGNMRNFEWTPYRKANAYKMGTSLLMFALLTALYGLLVGDKDDEDRNKPLPDIRIIRDVKYATYSLLIAPQVYEMINSPFAVTDIFNKFLFDPMGSFSLKNYPGRTSYRTVEEVVDTFSGEYNIE